MIQNGLYFKKIIPTSQQMLQSNLVSSSRTSSQSQLTSSPSGRPSKKSIKNVREKSHQEFYQNRIAKLTNIFKNEGYTLDALVTEEELLNILDTMGKEPFNREIASQLFEKIPKNPRSSAKNFVLQDFVDTHIKAEYLLLMQAEGIETELNQTYEEIENIKKTHKTSLNNIETNTLRIDMIEAICDEPQYEAEIGSIFSIILIAGGFKYESEEVVIEEKKFNPIFNHSFHLRLDNPDEKIEILLRDQKRYTSDPNYNDLKCTISLNSYKDQLKHVTWLDLYNFYRQPTKFKVHFDVQWQFSKQGFLEEKIAEIQQLQEKLKDEKEYVETSLRTLVHPFATVTTAMKTRNLNSYGGSISNISNASNVKKLNNYV